MTEQRQAPWPLNEQCGICGVLTKQGARTAAGGGEQRRYLCHDCAGKPFPPEQHDPILAVPTSALRAALIGVMLGARMSVGRRHISDSARAAVEQRADAILARLAAAAPQQPASDGVTMTPTGFAVVVGGDEIGWLTPGNGDWWWEPIWTFSTFGPLPTPEAARDALVEAFRKREVGA